MRGVQNGANTKIEGMEERRRLSKKQEFRKKKMKKLKKNEKKKTKEVKPLLGKSDKAACQRCLKEFCFSRRIPFRVNYKFIFSF